MAAYIFNLPDHYIYQLKGFDVEVGSNTIKKNYLYNLLYQMLAIVIPIITTPYISRVFGADGIGIQSYTMSISQYFVLLAVLGISTYGVREIALCRGSLLDVSRTFWEIELVCVVSTVVSLGLYIIFLLISQKYQLYLLIHSMAILTAAFDISWFFAGLEEFKHIVIRNSLIKIFGIIVLFLFIKNRNDLALYIFLSNLINLFGAGSMWLSLPQFISFIKPDCRHVKNHFKQTLIYFIPTIASSVYIYFDKTMLGMITNSPAESGYYEQCTKIGNMMTSIISSLNMVMFSRMAYLFAQNKMEEIKCRLVRSMEFCIVVSLPMMVGTINIAPVFVPLFLGNGYWAVVRLLQIYTCIIVICNVNSCLNNQLLNPCGKRLQSSYAIIVGAIVNFILNLILIPNYYAVGATIASVFSQIIICLIYVRLAKGYISWRIIFKIFRKPIVGACIMHIVLYFIKTHLINRIVSLILQVSVGILVYGISMLILKEKLVIEYCTRLGDWVMRGYKNK